MASSSLRSLSESPPVALSEEAPRRSITFRVVVLCLSLAVFFGYVIPIVDVKMSNTFMGAQHLPPSAVGVLIVLLLVVNPLLRLLSRAGKWGFSRGEVLTVYISCLFSTLVPGHGGEGFFISQIIGPFYFATRENKWLELWRQYVPSWMSPATSADGGVYGPIGHRAVEGWFNGLPPGGTIPWSAWFVPLLAWSTLIFAMYGALACLSVMLRAQWGDREALAFPLLRLPLEMTQDVDNADKYGVLGRFWTNSGLWLGAGLAVFVQTVNGLHLYFPDVPAIPLSLDMGPMLQESPWNQIGSVPIFIWPIVVGITFLLTSEVSFSLWFFYWFIKFQLLGAYFLGFSPGTAPRNGAGSVARVGQSLHELSTHRRLHRLCCAHVVGGPRAFQTHRAPRFRANPRHRRRKKRGAVLSRRVLGILRVFGHHRRLGLCRGRAARHLFGVVGVVAGHAHRADALGGRRRHFADDAELVAAGNSRPDF